MASTIFKLEGVNFRDSYEMIKGCLILENSILDEATLFLATLL